MFEGKGVYQGKPLLPKYFHFDKETGIELVECPNCYYIFKERKHEHSPQVTYCANCLADLIPWEYYGFKCVPVGKGQKIDSTDYPYQATKRKRKTDYASRGYIVVDGVPLHRKVLIDMGIDLTGLTVHHINGIKTDNRVENLYICTWKEHRRFHCGKLPNPQTGNVSEYLNKSLIVDASASKPR
jgi:hypothetical protein